MPARLLPVALAALLLHACAGQGPPPPPPGAIPAGERIGSATLSGRAIFNGEVPPPEEINMASDSVCATKGRGAVREDLVVGPGGALANVFVRVVSGLEGRVFAPPEAPALLDQDGCAYTPHVLGIQVNQVLEILNSDPTMHNVHTLPSQNRPFNVGLAVQGQRVRKFFTQPEAMIRIKCDLHNWMSAWIGVVEHPFFAVSGPEGSWSISGLPAGTYALEAWHESLGTRRAEVTVAEGGAGLVDFDFTK